MTWPRTIVIAAVLWVGFGAIEDAMQDNTIATDRLTAQVEAQTIALVDHMDGFTLPDCPEDHVIGWVHYPPTRDADLRCVHPDNLSE